MTVSLVVPCYNPPEAWEQTVCSSWKRFCSETGTSAELVLVIDGVSKNVTNARLSFLKQNIDTLKLISYEQNRGKGYALRKGVSVAAGDIIIYTDIDFPYKMESMLTVYQRLCSDACDIAIGIKDGDYYGHVPFIRRTISHFLRFIIRQFLSMPITDTQCGLKGFKKEAAHLFLTTTIDRYLFDLEFVRNCFKSKKYKVVAIPVTLNENVLFRSMNYRILLSESVNFMRLLFKRH